MVNRVLVGIDFSPASRKALKRAAEWAARLNCRSSPCMCWPNPRRPYSNPIRPWPTLRGSSDWNLMPRPLLEEWLAPYPGSTALIRTGTTAKMLVAEAEADTLLVIGNVGHGALDALLFGSTADRVMRSAQGDVLVVRAASSDR